MQTHNLLKMRYQLLLIKKHTHNLSYLASYCCHCNIAIVKEQKLSSVIAHSITKNKNKIFTSCSHEMYKSVKKAGIYC